MLICICSALHKNTLSGTLQKSYGTAGDDERDVNDDAGDDAAAVYIGDDIKENDAGDDIAGDDAGDDIKKNDAWDDIAGDVE